MGLVPQGELKGFQDGREGAGVRRVLKGVQDSGAVPVGEVEFTRGGGYDVMGDDEVDFMPERLDGD